MTKQLYHRTRRRKAANNLPDQLDLLSWHPAQPGPEASRIVRKVAERFHISPAHAQVVASLAGFEMEAAYA